ncbi:uncharacterized protein LOC115622666 [Scaptodrosophila lebanonensis]|uniref:Uncharacterized protein LOC115622666 n=1 Tax=Drosophila lebanonensis TaxID=7225 RepID=A0A6J2T6H2_DROLE|nr:uncharacterized protein LOC115622666 [Scaptodrosophila lebanonensis]
MRALVFVGAVLCFGWHLDLANSHRDWCAIPYCANHSLRHIACLNSGDFSEVYCHRRRLLTNMTNFRAYILKMFNKMRNEVAGGWCVHLEPAVHMPELVWNTELELMAEYRVKYCREPPKDSCYAVCGANEPQPLIAEVNLSPAISNIYKGDQIIRFVQRWISSLWELRRNDIRKYDAQDEPHRFIRPMAIGINEKNDQVGCSSAIDNDERVFRFQMICLFKMGPKHGDTIYKQGRFNHSRCKLGRSSQWLDLCRTEEKDHLQGIINIEGKPHRKPIEIEK